MSPPPHPAPRFFKGLGRNVVFLGVVSGLTDISSEMLYPVMPLFLTTVLGAPMTVVGLIEGVAEALELADRLGIGHRQLEDAIEGGPLDAPIADAKLHKMDQRDFAAEFPLEWALKDVDLAISAAKGDDLPLLAALSHQWHHAVDAGHGRQDVAAARLALGRQS